MIEETGLRREYFTDLMRITNIVRRDVQKSAVAKSPRGVGDKGGLDNAAMGMSRLRPGVRKVQPNLVETTRQEEFLHRDLRPRLEQANIRVLRPRNLTRHFECAL